ncbi:MAG: hypothetical protein GTO17_13380 [Candidatus Aminicenantes bacterium]|nr:hypothetical protein [Candidatus Aminicenantes bacterium]
MKKIIFTAALFFISTSFALLNAQWARTYGGKGEDCPFSIQQTSDGGYIVAGYTDSFGAGDCDVWILKLNAKGKVSWQKTIGKFDSDGAQSVQQTSDGGYVAAGWVAWDGMEYAPDDYWILKLKPDGSRQWLVFLGDLDPYYHSYERAYSVQQTSDGGYIVAGRKMESEEEEEKFDHDFCILKLDSNGEPEWQRMYGGRKKDDYAYSVQQTNDGGFIVAGKTESFGAGKNDFWILKLDSNGYVEWENTYGGEGEDYAESIQRTNDGGFIVAGTTDSFGVAGFDFWVFKLDSNGGIVWQKTYGGSRGDYAHSVQQTDDGGYVVAGSTGSFGAGKVDFWILKLGPEGGIKWQKAYGGAEYDSAFSVDQTSDGGCIVAGKTKSFGVGGFDFLVLKLTSTGAIDPSCGNFVTVTNAVVAETPASPDPTSDSRTGGGFWQWEYTHEIFPQNSNAAVRLVCESTGPYFLKISSTSGGTTDPTPGTYSYPSGAEVTIKALPYTHYMFTQWSGDFAGSTNPITVIMYTDLSITANFIRIIYPPLSCSGQKVLNRSLSQAEYINVLTWEANPNNVNIVKYRIYQVEGEGQSLLVELNADTFQYWHRNVDKDRQYAYILVAVNDEGREGDPAYISVQ